jgi:hypothetical protein
LMESPGGTKLLGAGHRRRRRRPTSRGGSSWRSSRFRGKWGAADTP